MDTVRGSESFLLTQNFNKEQKLESSSIELFNQNTLIKYTSSKQPLWGRSVDFYIKNELSSNSFMELLQKVFILKTHGASAINIHSEDQKEIVVKSSLKEVLPLPIKSFLKILNAQSFNQKKLSEFSLENRAFSVKDLSSPPKIIVTGKTHHTLAGEIAKEMNLPFIEKSEEIKNQHVILIGTPAISFNEGEPNFNDNIFTIFLEIDQLKRNNNFVHLLVGYYPYARSDKANDQNEGQKVGVYATLMAKIFESLGLDAITYVKAHAPQTQGFFQNIPNHEISFRRTIVEELKKKKVDLVVAPDTGAQKDCTLYAEMLQVPIIVTNKQRDPDTHMARIVGLDCRQAKGKSVAIIDDETASGGTLSEVASYLKKNCQVKKVYTVVTHFAGSGKKAIENPDIEELIVSNSFPAKIKHQKIKTLSIAKEVANYFTSL